MTECPKCHLPMVWSDREQRLWCCVYGDHQTVRHPVMRLVCDLDYHRKERVA